MAGIGALSYAGPALYGLQRGQDDQTKLNEELADTRQARQIRRQQADEQAALSPVRQRALNAQVTGIEQANAENAALRPQRAQATQAQLDASQIGLDEAKAQQLAAKFGREGQKAIMGFHASKNPQLIADLYNKANQEAGVQHPGWVARYDDAAKKYVFETPDKTQKLEFGQETYPGGKVMSAEDNLKLHAHALSNPQAWQQAHEGVVKHGQKMEEDAQKQANDMAKVLAGLKTPGKTPQELRLSLLENMAKNPLWATLPQPKRDEILDNALSFVQGTGAPKSASGNAPPSEIEGAKVTNDPKLGWIATKDGKTYRVNPPAKAAPAAAAAPKATALPTSAPAPRTALPANPATPDVLNDGAQYEASDADLQRLGNAIRLMRQSRGNTSAQQAADMVVQYADRLAQLQGAPQSGIQLRRKDGGAINPRMSKLDEQIKTARVRGDKETVDRLTRQRQTVAAL